jgi:hypothetical protein
MNVRSIRSIAIFAVVFLLVFSVGIILLIKTGETTLSFAVRDANSGAWVWDTEITLQDKIMKTYYQSSDGKGEFLFTHLTPGPNEMIVDAPSYIPETVPLNLKRGENRFNDIIYLQGYEIPGLDRFLIFETFSERGVELEIRPINGSGSTIYHHPFLEIFIGAHITALEEQTTITGEKRIMRGEILFSGLLDVHYSTEVGQRFQYDVHIPRDRILTDRSNEWIIDYVILVPDPRIADSAIVAESLEGADFTSFDSVLQELHHNYSDGIDSYVYTSWAVDGGPF